MKNPGWDENNVFIVLFLEVIFIFFIQAMNAMNSSKPTPASTTPASEQQQQPIDFPSLKLKSIPRKEPSKRHQQTPGSPKVALLPPKGPLKSTLTPLTKQNTGDKVKQNKTGKKTSSLNCVLCYLNLRWTMEEKCLVKEIIKK